MSDSLDNQQTAPKMAQTTERSDVPHDIPQPGSPATQDTPTVSPRSTPTDYYGALESLRKLPTIVDDSQPQSRESFTPARMETSEDLAEAMVIMEQNMILGRGLRLDLNAIELLGPSHQDILGSLGAILKTRTDKGKQKRWNSTLSTDRQKNHELVMDIIANGGFIDVVDRNPARAKDNDPTAPGFSSSYFGDYMDKLRPVRPLFCISRRFAALCVGGNGDQGPGKLPGDVQEQLLPLGDWRDNDGRAPKDRNIIYTHHFNTKETSHIGTHVVWFDITTPMQKHHGWMDCANAVKLAEHARMTLHESLKQQIELMKVPRDVVSNMYKAFDREIARVKA